MIIYCSDVQNQIHNFSSFRAIGCFPTCNVQCRHYAILLFDFSGILKSIVYQIQAPPFSPPLARKDGSPFGIGQSHQRCIVKFRHFNFFCECVAIQAYTISCLKSLKSQYLWYPNFYYFLSNLNLLRAIYWFPSFLPRNIPFWFLQL